MSFGYPWVAVIGAFAPLVLAIIFAIDFTRRKRVLDDIGDPALLQDMLGYFSLRRRLVKATALIIGLTGVLFAVSRPLVEGESSWRQRGIDVAIVLDFSKSMLAEDVYPSRFKRSLLEIDQLIDELEANRISAIASAGNAEYFPLTHDGGAARAFLAGMTPMDMAPGSDLGKAVTLATCVLAPERISADECTFFHRGQGRGQSGGGAPLTAEDSLAELAADSSPSLDRARAVVIFTDGGDTVGGLAAEIARAAEAGVHIYIVGVGTRAGELIPRYDASGRRVGWHKRGDTDAFVTTRLEAEKLEESLAVAGELGHLYVLGRDRFRRDDLLAKLDSLKKGNLDERVVRERVEVYHWFLFPAFFFLLLEALIRERRKGR